MWRSDDTSYFALASSGTPSRRTNWVGTMCVLVTRYLSISRSMSSGAHLSITTSVCPMWIAEPANTSTAVWYSGEPTMCTLSSNGWSPNM